jgi:hypothetical protein
MSTRFDRDALAEIPDTRLIPVPDPAHRFRGLPVATETLDGRTYRITRDVAFRLSDGRWLTVRVGFEFDWASVPRVFWVILPPGGLVGQPYGIGALVHDWLYYHQAIDSVPIQRAMADAVFLEIMLYTGVSPLIAHTMHRAVRMFGWMPWNMHARRNRQK